MSTRRPDPVHLPESEREAGRRRQAGLVIAVARPVAWLGLAVALLTLIPGLSAVPLLSFAVNLSSAGLAYLSVVLARRGRPELASIVFLVPIIASVSVAFFFFGGLRGSYVLFFPVFVCLMGLLRGFRAAVGLAIWFSALVVLSIVLERRGIALPHLDPGNLLNAAVVVCSSMFVTALFLGVALRLLERQHAELRMLERTREQTQRLEGLGRLAGGVAHDLNNILAPVLGAELLLEERSLGPDARVQIEQVVDAGKRAAALTGQLLAFARRGSLEQADLDLNRVLEDFAPLLRKLLPSRSELVLELGAGLPLVRAERAQLEQVVLNLVVNARDATATEGGPITVATGAVVLDPAFCAPRGLRAGPHLRLEVRDHGVGIAPEVMAHLFEPFFTTKGPSGTGLGLATVYGNVKRCGGEIEVESTPGEGASFQVLLPAVTPRA